MFRSLRIAALPLSLAYPGLTATAHSWYPDDRCHDQDCAVVETAERLLNGEVRVKTARGIGLVRADTHIQTSPDKAMHACLPQVGPDEEHLGRQLVWLFVPGVI